MFLHALDINRSKNLYVLATGCYIVRQCYCETGFEKTNTWKKTITLKLKAFQCHSYRYMYKENHFWNYHEVNILKTKVTFLKKRSDIGS